MAEENYRVYCKDCKLTFNSDVRPVRGRPCPNLLCPRGNPLIDRVWWERPAVRTALLIGGVTIGAVLYFDLGGAGAFALDLAAALLVQALLALVLFGLLLAICMVALKEVLGALLFNRYVLLGLFLIAAVLALPMLPFVSGQPVDYWNVLLTIVLGIAANLFTKPLERLLSR